MAENYTRTKLDGVDRPRFLYRYAVVGRAQFPVDMLRFDACWPASSGDAVKIAGRHTAITKIDLTSYREPTEGRWNSFGWVVEKRF